MRYEVEGIFTVVTNGDKAWTIAGGQTNEMTGEKLELQKEALNAGTVGSLVPLKDEKYGLTVVGDVTAEGRPCTAIKVSLKDRKDVFLDFDKESGLLTRTRYRVWSDEMSKDVDQEVSLFDYADKHGAKMPGRVIVKREGKVFVEIEVTENEPSDSLPESLFNP